MSASPRGNYEVLEQRAKAGSLTCGCVWTEGVRDDMSVCWFHWTYGLETRLEAPPHPNPTAREVKYG